MNQENLNFASVKKLRTYSQNMDTIRDPYAQISNSGFTPIGNLKTYGVANMYDRAEPTRLRELKTLYTLPYSTTPFLGNNAPSIKYIDSESLHLRPPVFQNTKSAKTISEVSYFPSQVFIPNNGVSSELNNFYEQATTINMNEGDRSVNRWNIVDPRITQNVDNIIMNMKMVDGSDRSLFSCGISTRDQLRNYVEINNC